MSTNAMQLYLWLTTVFALATVAGIVIAAKAKHQATEETSFYVVLVAGALNGCVAVAFLTHFLARL